MHACKQASKFYLYQYNSSISAYGGYSTSKLTNFDAVLVRRLELYHGGKELRTMSPNSRNSCNLTHCVTRAIMAVKFESPKAKVLAIEPLLQAC